MVNHIDILLTPEEDKNFISKIITIVNYLNHEKNKIVGMNLELQTEYLAKMFELYISDYGRVFLKQRFLYIKNFRRVIREKITEFRECVVSKRNYYFMELMTNTIIMLDNIENNENIADEENVPAPGQA